MTTRSVTVVNPLGLHARAAARFVHIATRFESHIRVGRAASATPGREATRQTESASRSADADRLAPGDSKVMDGKSIMGILLLAAARGTTLIISAEGPDEQAAVEALVQLVDTGFGEPSAGLGPGDSWNA